MSVYGGSGGAYASAPLPPRVRFEIIGESWDLLIKQFGVWLVAGLIFVLPIVVVVGGLYAFLMFQAFSLGGAGRRPDFDSQMLALQLRFYGIAIPVGILLSAFEGVIQGGMIRMAIRQMRGESLAIGDIFKVGDVFWPLVAVGILQNIAFQFGTMLCVLPGYILGGLYLLALPLVTEQRMSAIEALRVSLNVLKADIVNTALFFFVVTLIASLGATLCGIGCAFTLPFLPIATALLYRDFFLGGQARSGSAGVAPTEPSNPWASH